MNFSTIHVDARHVLTRAVVCGTLLMLVSCGIPGLRHAEPAPDLPGSFNGVTSPDNSAQLGIAEFYGDPLLTSLIDQALTYNRELLTLNEEVQIASNEIVSRRGAYLPFVTFGAEAGLNRSSLFTPEGTAERKLEFLPGKEFPDPLGNFMAGFNLFWQLDIWRELRNARDAAIQRYLAATEKRNYFASRLVAESAENYYRLLALDKRMETLDKTIELQEQSYKIAKAKLEAGRGTELAVKRFEAEVRKNYSEKLIVKQDIVEVENRINALLNRFPQPVERVSAKGFFDLNINRLSVGVPAQLLLNRADIRQAERELEATGFEIGVARARFFPRVDITAGIGYQAFDPRYLFNPEALIGNVAGHLVAPLLNKKAIQADFMTANARQLAALYNYQRTVLNAFTEVVNRVSKVENYSKSIALKKQQLESLEASVNAASQLFQNARVEYVEVLLAQRDFLDGRMALIETKQEQLSAIVSAYQALGGGSILAMPPPAQPPGRPHLLPRLWPWHLRPAGILD